jgi:hypothetical protein
MKFISKFLFFLSVLSICYCKTFKPVPPPKRPMNESALKTSDKLYQTQKNNSLVDLTQDKARILEILKKHKSNNDLMHHLESLDEFVMHYLVFPLRIGIVVQPGKEKYVSNKEIQHGIDILNAGIVDTWVQFKIVAIDTIYEDLTIKKLKEDNYDNYYNFSKKYDHSDTCSLYLVDNEVNLCLNFVCARTQGFANILENETNNVVLDKFFMNDRKLICHEFGHYFGLYHTAETRFGLEKIDGSNCETAGDKLCDTPADPGELFNVYINYTSCHMAGFREEGTELEYKPIINNYMSYFHPCYMRKFMFTPRQLEVIFRSAIWFRPNQIIELGEMPLSPIGL